MDLVSKAILKASRSILNYTVTPTSLLLNSLMITTHPDSSSKVMGNVLKMEAVMAAGNFANRKNPLNRDLGLRETVTLRVHVLI